MAYKIKKQKRKFEPVMRGFGGEHSSVAKFKTKKEVDEWIKNRKNQGWDFDYKIKKENNFYNLYIKSNTKF
jgi:hypothetical protein